VLAGTVEFLIGLSGADASGLKISAASSWLRGRYSIQYDQQFWLYAAADPRTSQLLHLRLFSTTTTALTEIFLRELRQKHDIESAVFLVDGAQHLQTTLARVGLRFQIERNRNRNVIERTFRDLKRRTSSFSNYFSHVQPETAENWLQAFATWFNVPN
jgi:putative transposase